MNSNGLLYERRCATLIASITLLLTSCSATPPRPAPPPERLRIALFNIKELSTEKLSDVDERGVGRNSQARAAANIIQRVRPDVLIIQEIDHDYAPNATGIGANAQRFAEHYLAHGDHPIVYGHTFVAANNTGLLSGVDLDGNGLVATAANRGQRDHGGDCFGFGTYPGQYSMAVLGNVELRGDEARTFQQFLWRDFPSHHIPDAMPEAKKRVARLSSKSHWDLPVRVGGKQVHLLISHPTPPVFDGPEDLNGRRNFDEIGFWVDYIDDGNALYDDRGQYGGLRRGAPFVIIGDLNARPQSTQSIYEGRCAIAQLLEHPRILDTNRDHPTATFGGGSRVDYVLPSRVLSVVGQGVFAPDAASDPQGAGWAAEASDHHLVWIEILQP